MAQKTVLVTGASRGIGKAIATKFAKKGYNIAINCVHSEDRLLQAKREIESYQVPCLAYLGDMGKIEDCQELFNQIRKQFGSLDVLVNNAGVAYIGLLQDMSPEDWNRVIQTNLTSVFNCCKLAIPGMYPGSREKSLIFLLSGASSAHPARWPTLLPRAASTPSPKLLQKNWLPATSRSMLLPAVPLTQK